MNVIHQKILSNLVVFPQSICEVQLVFMLKVATALYFMG
jgi:hypothetical protein